MLRFSFPFTRNIKSRVPLIARRLHGVRHDPGAFYVKLEENDRAILRYKKTGRVLDMYSVNVPKKHGGRGIGRLLAEAAFTHVIVRNYRMYLSCAYLQRYYRTIRTQYLSEYVVGPPEILGGRYPVSMFPTLEADRLEGMPDPTDTDNLFNKE